MNAQFFFKLAALGLLACVPLTGESFYVELFAKTLVLAIFAMSLDLLVGYTGLVSFGHAAYFGVAAYAVALLSPKYEAASLWLVMPAAVGLSGLVALVVGLFVLRTKGIYFIMVTLAFAQLAFFVFHDTPLGGGSDGIYLNVKPTAAIGSWLPFDLDNPNHLYYFILAMLVLVYAFLTRVLQSPFGRVLVGIKSNEHRMQSMGYLTFRYKLAAFALAGALGGVAGFLYSVGIPPSVTASALAALRCLANDHERVQAVQARGQQFLQLAKAAGLFNAPDAVTVTRPVRAVDPGLAS